jgi:glycine/D-amino acid oxidase-like deaminating enzyme
MSDTSTGAAGGGRRARVAIIGGGAIGSAIAYFLSRDGPDVEVTVIERDFTYAKASSALSASSIRQQFSCGVNIRMSQFGIAFLRDIGDTLAVDGERPDIGLVEPGYLYLASAAGVPTLRENHAVQRAHGVDVALLETADLQQRFPWLSTDGIALGSLGLTGEGWFDGYSVLQAFRRKAASQGARYLQAEAIGFERDAGGRIQAIRLQRDGKPGRLACDHAVDAGGPWAAAVARWAGIELPVRARRRSVFSFSCPQALAACPLVIDSSGIWFRPEGKQFICGFAPAGHLDPDEPPLEVDYRDFDDILWPALAARVPAFEAVRMSGAWAGYYEMNTFDHNAILGLHPACGNLYIAAGFSGHGLQQSPAVGRGIAELIREGRYRTLDLGEVGLERLVQRRPLLERNVI